MKTPRTHREKLGIPSYDEPAGVGRKVAQKTVASREMPKSILTDKPARRDPHARPAPRPITPELRADLSKLTPEIAKKVRGHVSKKAAER
jgi:hypothetical protein